MVEPKLKTVDTAATMGAYWTLLESRLGRRDDWFVSHFWFSEERPDLDPRVGENTNPVVFQQSILTCVRAAFKNGDLGLLLCGAFLGDILSLNTN